MDFLFPFTLFCTLRFKAFFWSLCSYTLVKPSNTFKLCNEECDRILFFYLYKLVICIAMYLEYSFLVLLVFRGGLGFRLHSPLDVVGFVALMTFNYMGHWSAFVTGGLVIVYCSLWIT